MLHPNNWSIEVYKGHDLKRGFLVKELQEVDFYLKPLGIQDQYIEIVINCLQKQSLNPRGYPNIILFLNENNEPIGLEKFIIDWKQHEKSRKEKENS